VYYLVTLKEEHRLKLFEGRVLRKVFRSKSEEEQQGGQRQLHNGLGDLYCSPNIVRVIKSRRMRWVGHVVCMEEKRG
jgi:hypothetical protein